jgi:hypothetical protein
MPATGSASRIGLAKERAEELLTGFGRFSGVACEAWALWHQAIDSGYA